MSAVCLFIWFRFRFDFLFLFLFRFQFDRHTRRQVALYITIHFSLCLCLYPYPYHSPFPFPSLYLQCFFHTYISGYKHTTKGRCDFSSFCLLCFFTPEATYTAKPHKRRSRTASAAHDYPASFYCTLSDQTRNLIIIIIIIYPEILATHLHAHAYTPGHIYPGKTRTRFCYPCPGAPARDHGAGRITPLGKFGFSSYCTKNPACPQCRAYH